MVGLMDNENLSEGLFLKNYLGTVSAVPRLRTAAHMDTKQKNSLENGLHHAKIIHDGKDRRNVGLEDIIQLENEEEKEKKKEKKWTLGGLFRRKSKKDADDSSDESGEDKRGFLSRRKNKRDRRKCRTNGFDVVIPQHKENGEISVEQLWGGDPKPPENGPVRYIHRHPEMPKTLQVPKRRDSRSSGGSENTEGRKGRKEVMARAEAKRDLIRDDSSSDEGDSYQSNSSLNRMNGDCRRLRRSDRHKRTSKEEESQGDLRIIKSDFEGGRRMPHRWIYPESSDERIKLNLINHSGTPSPCRSPRALRQKQFIQNSYPTSTFPPGIHYQQVPARYFSKDVRNQNNRTNRNSEYNLPRSVSSENSNRKTLLDYEQFLNSCGSKEKSLSYDQNIHRAYYFENEPDGMKNPSRKANGGRGGGDIYNYSSVKTYNNVENRTDSTPSLRSGIFPQQPTQRTLNGNSFVDGFHPNRSTSYQYISPDATYHYPRMDVQKNTFYNVTQPPSILRYYADQNPRSRNPIHITCNPTEQPYLSDSQVVVKPVQPVRNSASDFWKLKDRELMKHQKTENSLKPPPNTRSRSNSPRLTKVDSKILKEEYNAAKVNKPPEPPVRRLSKQEVLARLQKCEQLKNQENEIRKNLKNETKFHNNNLDEALNELEMIYNSLRLKDEDLVERAERRDLPVYRPKNPITSVSVRDKIQNFYAEISPKNPENITPNGHQRAIPLRRSGIPDKTTDDMAFRRMNQKDRTDGKKLPQKSYLRSSPVQNVSPTLRKESPVLEPDVTFDDVVFRNIRHANSTLKIQDPQPPFGIPIGVITPAPNSDYLHATPTERFRPTFTSSKTPDIVKDDLAFRNLRKDHKTEPNKSELKKRAVRSLSANLYNIMQKDNPGFVQTEMNNNEITKSCEKTQSLTDLTKSKQALEKRLKELKEEKNTKRAEFFELSQETKKKNFGNLSWTDLADLNGNFEDVPKSQTTSEEGSKKFRSPVVELSKYPAAAPSSSLQGNPFKEPSLVDDDQLESLLTALAKEAENASKDLERQLEMVTKKTVDEKLKEFDRKTEKTKRRRNLSLSCTNETKEEVRKTGSLERRKTDKNVIPFEVVLREKPSKELAKKTNLKEEQQSFEVVTDLSQILHDVEVEQHLNNEVSQKETNTVFQEVYEYNCKLSSPERQKVEMATRNADVNSDVETEFEKLHEEVNSTKKTKETDLDDLMADIASVGQSSIDSYSSFPFPNETPSNDEAVALRHRDGTSPGSSKGEGIQQRLS